MENQEFFISIVTLVRCSSWSKGVTKYKGVDRTGEFAISYEIQYLNSTFQVISQNEKVTKMLQDAINYSDALCTKVNGRPVMPFMAFAAEW